MEKKWKTSHDRIWRRNRRQLRVEYGEEIEEKIMVEYGEEIQDKSW
jgi:hypothetical protein